MAQSAQIQKVSTKHEQIINYLISFPTAKYSEVAAHFGVTPAWLSTIIHSDIFQDQLKRRQDEFFDSAIAQPLGAKVSAAAHMVLDEYMEKIPTMNTDQLVNAGDKLLGKLGFGSPKLPNGGTVNIQNNYIDRRTLAEARSMIGAKDKVGSTDPQAALPHPAAPEGTEIEGVVVRGEGA